MARKIKFSYLGKRYSISNYKICNDVWSKMRGLMFRDENYLIPLLFVFSKPGKYGIHSFFCKKFIAVWILNNKVIDVKKINPWKCSVTLKEKFDELLEIPLIADE